MLKSLDRRRRLLPFFHRRLKACNQEMLRRTVISSTIRKLGCIRNPAQQSGYMAVLVTCKTATLLQVQLICK
jgi:hypothetical protein